MWVKRGLTSLCYGFFSTLANPTRLAIVELLDERPMSVSELVEELGQEQSMVSHNLSPLVRCHFVTRERKGKSNVYSLNHETMNTIIKAVENHAQNFCGSGSNCYLQQDEAN